MVHGLEVAGRDSKSGCVRECFVCLCNSKREGERVYETFFAKSRKDNREKLSDFCPYNLNQKIRYVKAMYKVGVGETGANRL